MRHVRGGIFLAIVASGCSCANRGENTASSRQAHLVAGSAWASDEIALDPPNFFPATAPQSLPVVASDGTDYFVVWSDPWRSEEKALRLFGSRITAAGEVLDKSGIALGSTPVNTASIAFDGSNYVVVWQDGRATSTTGMDIYAARISRAGVLLDPAGVPVCTAPNAQQNPRIAWNGSVHLVVWEDQRAGGSVGFYGSRLDTHLAVLDPAGLAIAQDATGKSNLMIATDHVEFLVAWTETRGNTPGLFATRVDTTGVISDAVGFSLLPPDRTEVKDPALAFGSSNYLVTWVEGDTLYGMPLASISRMDGGLVDGAVFTIDSGTLAQTALAYAQGNFLVTWKQSNKIYLNWVSESDWLVPLLIRRDLLSDETLSTPGLAASRTGFLATYFSEGTVRAFRLSPDEATPLDGAAPPEGKLDVYTMAKYEETPSVVFDGSNYFVAWIRRTSFTGDGEVVGVRLAGDGKPMDDTPVVISTASNRSSHPAVSSDGTYYYVVWQDQRSGTSVDLYGARIRKDTGALVDIAGNLVSDAIGDQTAPAIAFDGTNYLVVWLDSRNGSPLSSIYAAYVDPSTGSPLPSDVDGFPIEQSGRPNSVKTAFCKDHFLVAWTDGDPGSSRRSIRSRVVLENRILQGNESTLVVQPSVPAHDLGLASNGDGFYAVWLQDQSSGDASVTPAPVREIRGLLLDRAGIPRGQPSTFKHAEIVTVWDGYGIMRTFPAIIWNGKQYTAVWRQIRSSNMMVATWLDGLSGEVLGSSEYEPLIFKNPEVQPPDVLGLASSSDMRTLLVYTRNEPAFPYGNQRMWARFIPPLGAALDGGMNTQDSGSISPDLPFDTSSSLDAPIDESIPDISGKDAAVFDAASDRVAIDTRTPDKPSSSNCSCEIESRRPQSVAWLALLSLALLRKRKRS
jgi:hypothetical protein